LVNGLGGSIEVNANNDNPAQFDIVTTKVPSKACIGIVTNMDVIEVYINGNQVDKAGVTAACRATDSNTSGFVIKLMLL